MRRRAWIFGVSVALASACTSGDPAAPVNPTPAEEPKPAAASNGVTFHKDVAPILERVCQKCHIAGGIAPFALVTYDDAKRVAAMIVDETATRRMPPWGARTTPECTPPHGWKDDIRLRDEEIALLAAWQAGGTVEGERVAAAPRAPSVPDALEGARTLAPPPFTLTGTRDTLQCFVLDPQITTTQYLNGTYFVPSNRTVVHHALAFAIPPTAELPTDPVTQQPATRYECFGGPRVEGASLLGAWAPGAVPAEYGPDVGRAVEPGTRFILQVHYHPHANAKPDPDATAFQFRLRSEAPSWRAITQLIGNFRTAPTAGAEVVRGLLPGPDDPVGGVKFVIPPNARAHRETMTVTIPSAFPPVRIAGVGAHMHLAGRDEKVTLFRSAPEAGEKAEECLLQEPAWNFDWQRGYAYDAPIEALPTMRGSDRIEIRCTYENTMDNPKLAAAILEAGMTQPPPIELGESTTEEMCLAGFVFLRKP